MGGKQGPYINFFVDGNYKLQTPAGQPLQVTQHTSYPVSGNIAIEFTVPKPENMDVFIRIPAWSKEGMLTVNGEQIQVKPGGYAAIHRLWKTGDVVKLELDMRGRLAYVGAAPQYIAIMRGPVVLARDLRLGGPAVDASITPVTGKDSFINPEPAGVDKNGIWMKYNALFKVESYKEGGNKPIAVTLCDYASAGNTIDQNSWFRVWLPQIYDPREQ
ncbi:hypothetical protein [Mucilaginibacter humi]|uniref:hypothetical protein n=1 Tax=Mucilaginibacter humi TaxID=2732510 RepID=UPI003743C87D